MTSYTDIESPLTFSGHTITYTFDDAFYSVGAHDFATDFPSSGVSNVADGDSSLASAAMAQWSNAGNITFSAAGSVNTAQIGFMESDISPNGMQIRYGTHLPYDNGTNLVYNGVFVNKNNTGSSPYDFSKAFTYLHELGHALGLDHPNGDENDTAYNTDFTIMSARFGTYTSATCLPITPMLYDIAAIQDMYGINTSYNSGDTSITFTGYSLARTIWDGGGIDTLDASSQTSAVHLDLRAGFDGSGNQYYSHVGSEYVFMAYHADIENATGGSGNDYIYGNDPAAAVGSYSAFSGINTLDGGGGDDHIYGYGGNDYIIGGSGGDYLDGGDGEDTLVYSGAGGGVTVDLSTNSASGSDAAGDTIMNFEDIIGSTHNDTLTGDSGANFLHGNSGDDTINGGAGIDIIHGGVGVDVLTGGADKDYFLYLHTYESGTTTGTRDTITDFNHSQGDLIDVGAMKGFATDVFIGSSPFSGMGTRSEVRSQISGGNTLVSMDSDGNGTADWQIILSGAITLVSGDFVLT